MTEPRKLQRGQNSWSATVDAARAALGEGSPRGDGGRVLGDPLDVVLGTSTEGLRASQAGRQYGRGFAANVHHAGRQAPTPSPAKPAQAPADDLDAAKVAWTQRLDEMEPAEVAALEAALDARVAVDLGSVSEFDFEEDDPWAA